MSVINKIEKQRASDTNPGLDQKAFEAAWHAFQNTPIDLLADSDDEQFRCVGNAILAYIRATDEPEHKGGMPFGGQSL